MSVEAQTIKLFWHHAWRYPKHVIGLFVVMAMTAFTFDFLPPLIVADIINRLTNGQYEQGDLIASFGPNILLFLALLILGGTVGWRISVLIIWKLEALVVRDIHQRVFKHLMQASANFHANRFAGSLTSATNKLAGSYIRFADVMSFELGTLILSFVFTFIILWPRAPMFVIVLFIFSVIYVLVSIKITKHLRELSAIEANKSNKQTGHLADSLTNVLAVKSFATSDQENKRYALATEATRGAVLNNMRATTKRDIFFAMATTIIEFVALTMAVASVVLFNTEVALVFLILTYTSNIVRRLWDFSRSTLRNLNRSLADAREMTEELNIEPEVKDPENPEEVKIKNGEIEFNNMNFTHGDSKKNETLFEDFNLHIKPGEKIGLVGHSGSGKSTLVKLLLRFADIDSGEILIDGQSISMITQDDLRRNIAYVPQEPLLFHRSIQENIAYGKADATKAEILSATSRANATEFIAKLPQGFETLVGERGVKLSGGQRQRIAIARAILKEAPILLLDEATSALDSESERLIQSALKELMKGRTAIVIAHRLSTIQKMDRIIVLHDGKIVEQGTHDQLVHKQGVYHRLWQQQSGGFIAD